MRQAERRVVFKAFFWHEVRWRPGGVHDAVPRRPRDTSGFAALLSSSGLRSRWGGRPVKDSSPPHLSSHELALVSPLSALQQQGAATTVYCAAARSWRAWEMYSTAAAAACRQPKPRGRLAGPCGRSASGCFRGHPVAHPPRRASARRPPRLNRPHLSLPRPSIPTTQTRQRPRM